MQNYTFRLKPGQDLFNSIEDFVMEKQVKAGCLLSGVKSDPCGPAPGEPRIYL
jgi:predicted DNA-binding protein with PD1-like motif